MNCQEFVDKLEEMALHGPDIRLTAAMEAHCGSCADCLTEFHQTQDSWLALSAGLEPVDLNPERESELFEKIALSNHREKANNESKLHLFSYALALSILLILVTGTFYFAGWFSPNRITETEIQKIKEFAAQLNKLEEMERVFAQPNLRYVSLRRANADSEIQGYLIYDFLAEEAHFFGLNMQNENLYKIWLLDVEGNVLDGVAIDANDRELGSAILKLPADLDQLSEVVVSIEQDRTAEVPSSEIFLRSMITP